MGTAGVRCPVSGLSPGGVQLFSGLEGCPSLGGVFLGLPEGGHGVNEGYEAGDQCAGLASTSAENGAGHGEQARRCA